VGVYRSDHKLITAGKNHYGSVRPPDIFTGEYYSISQRTIMVNSQDCLRLPICGSLLPMRSQRSLEPNDHYSPLLYSSSTHKPKTQNWKPPPITSFAAPHTFSCSRLTPRDSPFLSHQGRPIAKIPRNTNKSTQRPSLCFQRQVKSRLVLCKSAQPRMGPWGPVLSAAEWIRG
jgi:hypothetical protein